jgi:hypothetical protein
MNALVIQFNSTAVPPRSRPIAGVATAPPEKLIGRITAARQTAARIEFLPFVERMWFVIVALYLQKR